MRRHLAPFRFPLLLLECDAPVPRIRVTFADRELIKGLSLADALYEELDLLISDTTAVAFVPRDLAGDSARDLSLAAELLHATILRDAPHPQQVPSLFDWAFRSLSAGWPAADIGQAKARDRILAQVLGYPDQRAGLCREAYLQLLDPGHHSPEAVPSLGRQLARMRRLPDWQSALWASYDAARCSGSINIGQN